MSHCCTNSCITKTGERKDAAGMEKNKTVRRSKKLFASELTELVAHEVAINFCTISPTIMKLQCNHSNRYNTINVYLH